MGSFLGIRWHKNMGSNSFEDEKRDCRSWIKLICLVNGLCCWLCCSTIWFRSTPCCRKRKDASNTNKSSKSSLYDLEEMITRSFGKSDDKSDNAEEQSKFDIICEVPRTPQNCSKTETIDAQTTFPYVPHTTYIDNESIILTEATVSVDRISQTSINSEFLAEKLNESRMTN